MIERTVSNLEPCKLRGIIRKAANQVPKQRLPLRTGFWQHGASAIELSHGWPAIVEEHRKPEPAKKTSRADGAAARPLESELQASAFRLDFLYPSFNLDRTRSDRTNSKRPSIHGKEKKRKYATSSEAAVEPQEHDAGSARTEGGSTALRPSNGASSAKLHRTFQPSGNPEVGRAASSSAPKAGSSRTSLQNGDEHTDVSSGGAHQSMSRISAPDRFSDVSFSSRFLDPDPESNSSVNRNTAELDSIPHGTEALGNGEDGDPQIDMSISDQGKSPSTSAAAEATRASQNKGVADPQHLDDLLDSLVSDTKGTQHLDVYDLYARLAPEDRTRCRPRVIVYLSKSRNIVAFNRSRSLFRQVDEELWTDELLAAGVDLFLRSSERPQAVNIFKRGVLKMGLSGGLEHLLVSLFRTRSWSGALKLWRMWYDIRKKKGEVSLAKEVVRKLAVLERRLPELYFSFEQYLASGRVDELDAHTLQTTDEAVDVLRRRFARMALDRSSPSRAEVILGFYQSRRLYHRYLEMMTMKWIRREIDKETAAGLPKIYENYRQQKGFRPSESVLHGMFEVYYPTELHALSVIHDDWVRAHGELSESAFNKYFKLYAKLGMVAATRDLAERFQKKFPSKGAEEGPLRLMKVYARQGDKEAVDMIEDTLPHNSKTLLAQQIRRNQLLACAQADEHTEAVACFEDMDRLGLLGHADYEQMMHMFSRDGNVDETLRYFGLAQDKQVNITPGMVHSIVTVFIRNDRLKDAESIAVMMANRGVSNADVWTELLQANAKVGNIPRCYGILAAMEQRKIDPSPRTYKATLSAMVRYGQIGAAVALLKNATRTKRFNPTDEHYAVVMIGALRVGDFNVVARLARDMKVFRDEPSFAAKVALLAAAVQSGASRQETKTAATDVVKAMDSLNEQKRAALSLHDSGQSATLPGSVDPHSTSTEAVQGAGTGNHLVDVMPAAVSHATSSIGHAVALLAQLRDEDTTEELISSYLKLQPPRPGEPLPEQLMSSLVRAYHNNGEFGRVLETWEQYWSLVLGSWMRQDGRLVKPTKQYALLHILDTVTMSYRAVGDVEGLEKFVMKVYVAGFKMSSNSWNRIVQTLTELDQLEVAARWCEVVLMPYWRGWQRLPGHGTNTRERNRFVRAIRMARLDPHFMRPHQETILMLRERYRRLRTLGTWSNEDKRLAATLTDDNPRLFRAFERAPLGFERKKPKWVVSGGTSLEQQLDKFVGTLTLDQAKQMKASLATLLQGGSSVTMMKDLKQLLEHTIGANNDPTAASQSVEVRKKVLRELEEQDAVEAEADEIPEPMTEEWIETQPTDPRELEELRVRVAEKLEVDRAEGDKIIHRRMSRWMARTWRRDRWTRWGDQWAGWGDQTNTPP